MEKKVIWFGMMALAMCSCSSDIVLDSATSNQQKQIGFSTSVEGMTRAVTTTGSLEQFVVHAQLNQGDDVLHYIDALNVNKVNGTWQTEKEYLWPYSGKLNFYSYSPA
ncbi:MAG: hypothetical protein HUK03_10700, partial [Bacteroidaceae bacterium]|nr:hypothetical protein [Bacteroidaceae bacterium]